MILFVHAIFENVLKYPTHANDMPM